MRIDVILLLLAFQSVLFRKPRRAPVRWPVHQRLSHLLAGIVCGIDRGVGQLVGIDGKGRLAIQHHDRGCHEHEAHLVLPQSVYAVVADKVLVLDHVSQYPAQAGLPLNTHSIVAAAICDVLEPGVVQASDDIANESLAFIEVHKKPPGH